MLLRQFQEAAGIPDLPQAAIPGYLIAWIVVNSASIEDDAALVDQVDFIYPLMNRCAQLANWLGVSLAPSPSITEGILPSDLIKYAQKLAQLWYTRDTSSVQVAALNDDLRRQMSQLLQHIVRCLAAVAEQSNTSLQRIIGIP